VWNNNSTLLGGGGEGGLTRVTDIGYTCKPSCMVYHVLNVPHVLSPALFPSRCSTGPLRSWTPTDWHSNTCHFHTLQNRATVLGRGGEQCSWWLECHRTVSSQTPNKCNYFLPTQPLATVSTRSASWRVKAAGALGRQTYHLHVPIIYKQWEPQSSAFLRTCASRYRDWLYLLLTLYWIFSI
jgi:hypothetical protein